MFTQKIQMVKPFRQIKNQHQLGRSNRTLPPSKPNVRLTEERRHKYLSDHGDSRSEYASAGSDDRRRRRLSIKWIVLSFWRYVNTTLPSTKLLPDYAQDTIDLLHSQGKWVVCYISIGTLESWRDDAENFPDSAIGSPMEDWDGENWLDVNNAVCMMLCSVL